MIKEHNTASPPSLKLCRIVTVPFTFQTALHEQLQVILSENIALSLVASPGPGLDGLRLDGNFDIHPVPMSRQISPFADLRALYRLIRLFRTERFDIVHSGTPKAGLLAALAGFIARVPVRMHTYTGQVWVELDGWKRAVSRRSDWVVARLNTHTYADGHSQRQFLLKENICPSGKISVHGAGSIAGVNLARFNAERWAGDCAALTRRELGIAPDASVILFVGRITRDKGIGELIAAFKGIQEVVPGVELVLAGNIEQVREPLPELVIDELAHNPRIHSVGFTPTPEKYMGMADVICLPSYREGFASVIIEAAAMGLPAVTTDIVGLVDTVEDGETGILVPAKNHQALRDALCRLLQDKSRRLRMGQEARQRAVKLFDARSINRMVIDEYFRVSRKPGSPEAAR